MSACHTIPPQTLHVALYTLLGEQMTLQAALFALPLAEFSIEGASKFEGQMKCQSIRVPWTVPFPSLSPGLGQGIELRAYFTTTTMESSS